MKQIFSELRQGIATAISSDEFLNLFGIATTAFLLGILLCFAAMKDLNQRQCDEMSITEALQYPYCRTYFENEMKDMEK